MIIFDKIKDFFAYIKNYLESKYRGGGAIPSKPDSRDYSLYRMSGIQVGAEMQFPSEYLIVPKEQLIGPYNQGATKACVAYALKTIKDYQEMKQAGTYIPYSWQFIYGNRSTTWESMDTYEGLNGLIKDGTCKEADFKSISGSTLYQRCASGVNETTRALALDQRIQAYARLTNDMEIKYALMNYGAVYIVIPILSGYFSGTGDSKVPPAGLTSQDYHALCIIGWNDTTKRWLIQNSWGGDFTVKIPTLPYQYPIQQAFLVADISPTVNYVDVNPKLTSFSAVSSNNFYLNSNLTITISPSGVKPSVSTNSPITNVEIYVSSDAYNDTIFNIANSKLLASLPYNNTTLTFNTVIDNKFTIGTNHLLVRVKDADGNYSPFIDYQVRISEEVKYIYVSNTLNTFNGTNLVINANSPNYSITVGNKSWQKTVEDPSIIVALPNTGATFTPTSSTNINDIAPRYNFTVKFPTTGRYYIWVYGYGKTTSDNSVHLGLEGVVGNYSKSILVPTGTVCGWAKKMSNGQVAYLYVDTKYGDTKNINLYPSKDGVCVKQIILTTDPNFVPTT